MLKAYHSLSALHRSLVLFLLCLGIGMSHDLAFSQDKIYWTDSSNDKIQRANLDGSTVEDLLSAVLSDPRGIALDVTGGKMYWTNLGSGVIRRANLDGTGVEDLLTELRNLSVSDIALDLTASKMYWAEGGSIRRANLDGTNPETVISGLQSPYRLALDITGGKVYWTDVGFDGKIQRANLDGTGVEDLVTGLVLPKGIALDVAASKMYWTIDPNDPAVQKIQRANLDGSNVEDVVLNPGIFLDDLALDVAGGKMYWSDANVIRRANLDGSNVENIATGFLFADGIALDLSTGKLYWTDIFAGKIQRANLNGSNVEDLIVAVFAEPESIAIDAVEKKMYWGDPFTRKIQRANLDGTEVEDIIATSGAMRLFQAQYLAIDETGRKLYWTGGNGIHRANLDSTGIETVVTGLSVRPSGIALDMASGKVYWTEAFFDNGWNGSIRRANLDGTDVEDVAPVSVGLSDPRGIDIGDQKIYWTDVITDKIQRADFDGTNVEDLVASGINFPEDIVLDAAGGKMYWAGPGTIRRANLDGTSVEDLVTAGLINPRGIAVKLIAPIERDSLALVALYNATDGPNWTNNTNWLTGPVSTWFGVTVENDRVTELNIDDNALKGPIPPELGNLAQLRSLSLQLNQLSGSTPPELGNLANLSRLNLGSNQLTGGIPPELGNLTNSGTLDLADNQLTGEVPAELNNLTNLSFLRLDDNRLIGAIPTEFVNLTNLRWLTIQGNQFDDLPDFSANGSLVLLFMQENRFTFEHIEPYIGVVDNFMYAPQAKIGTARTEETREGSSLTLYMPVGGTFNIYQWLKDGQVIDTTDTYTITSASAADAGQYVLRIFNTLATDLGLESEPITVTVEVSAPDGPARWNVADGGNGHLYQAILVPEGISWTEANVAAEAMGNGWHLATITSAEENAFVYSLVSGDPAFWNCCLSGNSAGPWLGGLLTGPGRTYGWVTGEAFDYTNWGPNEPFGNGDRIGFFGYQAFMGPFWNDVPASRPEYGYIVENSTIVKVSPDTTAAGGNLEMEATLIADFQPTTSQLFYRRSGETTYQSTTLAPVDSNYVATIPGEFVTLRGLDYYVVFSDGQTTLTFPSISDPDANPAHVRVHVEQLPAPVALPSLTYRMVSVPLALDDTRLPAVLEDDYGVYDSTQWRLFRWDSAQETYHEFSNIAASFSPGTAFWLNTRTGAAFDVDDGLSVDASQPYPVTLEPGWNQIATPFAFPIAWADVANSDLVEAPVTYDGVEYQFDQAVLEPWQGYFVYNPVGNPVTLAFSPVEATAATNKAAPSPATVAEAGYVVRLGATVPGTALRDSENYLGFDDQASQGRDRLDFAEPPGIGSHLRLSLIEEGEALAGSFKPVRDDGQQWQVEIAVEMEEEVFPVRKQVQVTLLEHGERPEGFDLYVLDGDLGRRVAVEEDVFSLEVSPSQPVRHLRVIVGTAAYAESERAEIPLEVLEDALLANYPNPFNRETVIGYVLGERKEVELGVYDVLGRRVRVLVKGEQGAGRHEVVWDGRDERGAPVSSGVYMFRLEADSFRAIHTMLLLR